MGRALDRSLPSHLAADAPSLLGTDFVFRVPVRHPHPPSKGGKGGGGGGGGREGGKDGKDDEEKLLVTVLVKKAIHSQPPPSPPPAAAAAAATGKEEEEDDDDDSPLILLLHGFPDDASTFHAQLFPFATAGFDVIVPVMPGYEPSTALLPPESYSLPALATMLEDVVDWAVATSFVHGDEGEEEEEGENAEKGEEKEKEYKQKECKPRKGGRKIHILGHDWGAALAYLLAGEGRTSVGRIASIVTLAVPHNPLPAFLAHPGQFVKSWYMIFMVGKGGRGERREREWMGGWCWCFFPPCLYVWRVPRSFLHSFCMSCMA